MAVIDVLFPLDGLAGFAPAVIKPTALALKLAATAANARLGGSG
jgi:hypothetical protein